MKLAGTRGIAPCCRASLFDSALASWPPTHTRTEPTLDSGFLMDGVRLTSALVQSICRLTTALLVAVIACSKPTATTEADTVAIRAADIAWSKAAAAKDVDRYMRFAADSIVWLPPD